MKFLLVLLITLTVFAPGSVLGQGKTGGMPFDKYFYLTTTEYFGDEVLGQCASGYHVASFWEIRDTSGLVYNTQLGFTTDESGFGPPTHVEGWLLSGGGFPDCDHWTSSANGQQNPELGRLGSFGFLAPEELMGEGNGDGWFRELHPCWVPIKVWCVSD